MDKKNKNVLHIQQEKSILVVQCTFLHSNTILLLLDYQPMKDFLGWALPVHPTMRLEYSDWALSVNNAQIVLACIKRHLVFVMSPNKFGCNSISEFNSDYHSMTAIMLDRVQKKSWLSPRVDMIYHTAVCTHVYQSYKKCGSVQNVQDNCTLNFLQS
jgi:hypothetical protein